MGADEVGDLRCNSSQSVERLGHQIKPIGRVRMGYALAGQLWFGQAGLFCPRSWNLMTTGA